MLGSGAAAQDDPPPDSEFLEFLEYLGSWEAGDEEWVEYLDDEHAPIGGRLREDPPDEAREEAKGEDDVV